MSTVFLTNIQIKILTKIQIEFYEPSTSQKYILSSLPTHPQTFPKHCKL